MKKIVALIVLVFCVLSAFAQSDVRVFKDATAQNWGNLERFLSENGRLKHGFIDSSALAEIAYEVAKNENVIATTLPVFSEAFYARNKLGRTITVDEFLRRGQNEGFWIPVALLSRGVETAEVHMPSRITMTVLPPLSADTAPSPKNGGAEADRSRQARALAILNGKLSTLEKALSRAQESSKKSDARELRVLSRTLAEAKDKATKMAKTLGEHDVALKEVVKAVTTNATHINEQSRKIASTLQSAWDEYRLYVTSGAVAVFLLLVWLTGRALGEKRRTTKVASRAASAVVETQTAAIADKVATLQANVSTLAKEVTPLRSDVDVLQAIVEPREIDFPHDFNDKIEALGRGDPNLSHYSADIRVKGLKDSVQITVAPTDKAGYVTVSGIPGHNPVSHVLVHKDKASTRHNGVALLCFKAANGRKFDPPKVAPKRKLKS